MSPQDEEIAEALFGPAGDEGGYGNREPQVTVDGYDYGTLLMSFDDVFATMVQNDIYPTGEHYFLAPGYNASFSYQ